MTLARRKFLKQAAATATYPLWYKSLFGAPPAAPRIRYNVLSPEGQAMVRKYSIAVGRMKALSASNRGNPLGWVFQWYTHAIPSNPPIQKPPVPPQKVKADAIQAIYGSTSSPQRTLAQQAWYTCQPHQQGQNTDFFLPWHRMFVLFFEEIVRSTLGDDSFTLPYWNYSPGLPASHQSGVMPANFRQPANAQNPLYVQNRYTWVNAGSPIDSPPGDSGGLSAAGALAEMQYSPNAPLQGFCNNLDFNLHGNVHDFVGTGTNMGYVPTAGEDPVFWMHHCNIDRLWASWNRAGRKNPTYAAFLNQTFWFAGLDGKGHEIAVKDVLNIATLNYTYQEFQPVPGANAQKASSFFDALTGRSPVASAKTIALATNLSLSSGAAKVALRAQEKTANKSVFDLALGAPAPGVGRYYLVVRDLQVANSPGTGYRIYLNLPDGATDAQKAAHYVGLLSFFSAMPGMPMNSDDRFVSFDISSLVRRLGAASLSGPLNLTVSSVANAAEGSTPVIGSAAIVQI
jgi:tyrosinase